MNVARLGMTISAALIVSCAGESPSGALKSERDLTKYDRAGPYVEEALDMEQAIETLAKIREFIWRHWHMRRLGYLHAVHKSPEGGAGTVDYYIEPDAEGIWQVTVEWQSDVMGGGLPAKKPVVRRGIEHGCTLERVRPPGKKDAGHIFPASAEVPGDIYNLIFKDRDGKVTYSM